MVNVLKMKASILQSDCQCLLVLFT